MVTHVMTHYDNNDLLMQYQYGFRSKHRAKTQLIGAYKMSTTTLNFVNEYLYAIVIDYVMG